jgi:hypothetical protein
LRNSAAIPAALCAAFAALPAAHAQAVGDSRAAILLTLPASARGLALGEAWAPVADDESALFYNPAQLARVRGTAAGGSVQHYVANTTLGAFAMATRAAHGTVALGVQVLDYGTEDEIVSSGGPQGTPTGGSVSAQDIALTAGYGLALGARGEWRVGTAVKLARQHVANVSGSAVAADLGAGYSAANGWELSAALQHLGSRLTLASVAAPLPYTWRVAVASPVIRGLLGEQFAFRTMAEARQSSGGAATGVLATEGTWRAARDALALSGRAGYAFRGAGDDRRPLTVGGGITLARVTVDYAYEGFDLLGATHRVGVRFGAPSSAR